MEAQRLYESPLGTMVIQSTAVGITKIGFVDAGTDKQGECPALDGCTENHLAQAVVWLDEYFAGRAPKVMPPLDLRGTAFQKTVWQLLIEISYGKTLTYGALAKRVALLLNRAQMSSQAIGGAVGKNPVAIIVPCHRVVGADGRLTGYAWGLERKRALLELENARD